MSGFESQIDLQDRNMRTSIKLILIILAFPLATTNKSNASPEEDAKTVAALDTKYQAAVKANDAATMDQILADNFVLVTGRGSVFSKADLLDSARKKEVTYERQEEEPGTQKVRMWGDTAVVTALLWIKSVQAGKPADYKLWFSDTYVRTPTGWRYVFGQASLPLPKAESPPKP
jgi:ketosteroid isomerase-like protein